MGGPKAERCIPLKASERTRLEAYIRKKLKVPASVALKISDAPDQECGFFRKLDVRADDPARKTQMSFYASPDLRFLTRDLLDTRIDPEIEDRRREQEFQAGLNQGDFPVLGPAEAPVTIMVFSDFQCPFCGRFAQMLRKSVLSQENPDVRIVFREFPLQMHAWALPAAKAAVCAAQQNNESFWKLHAFCSIIKGS
jgi:Thioredoxin